jgi:hypothetical protein
LERLRACVAELRRQHPDDELELWCEDEARLGRPLCPAGAGRGRHCARAVADNTPTAAVAVVNRRALSGLSHNSSQSTVRVHLPA